MHPKYNSLLAYKIVEKHPLFNFLVFLLFAFFSMSLNGQTLLDNYDGTGTLTYTLEGTWVKNAGKYEGQTGSVTTPEHSYASFDLSTLLTGYNLSKTDHNTWFGWIDLNQTVVSGWGASVYSAGMVLAANSSDFNAATTSGYAIVFRDTPDELVLIKFSGGITSGATALPINSTQIVSSGYTYAAGDDGVNFFVRYNSDGKWSIFFKSGAQLSDADAVDFTKYTTGNATSTAADETYIGNTYKYSGWVFAHSTAATKAYFDNFGADFGVDEPTNHVSSFTTIPLSHKDLKNTWLDNDGAEPADGFLILANLNGTFSEPIDGTAVANDTDLSDGNGAINIAHGVLQYTWTNLNPATNYHFIIYPYQGSGTSINYKTAITVPTSSGTTAVAPDADSYIDDPLAGQPTAGSLSSVSNVTALTAKEVFRFKIIDKGTTDALSTIVDTLLIRPYSSNTTDWTNAIQGIKLNNGSSITPDTVNITDSYLEIIFLSNQLVIANNSPTEVTLSVYLNTTALVDNSIFSCYINGDAHGFVADDYGSTFTADPLPTGNIFSNDFLIDVDATKLIFNSIPSVINIDTDFTVEVWATDTYGNLDKDNVSEITLSEDGTNGTLSSTGGLIKNLAEGIYTWADTRYDYAESFNISASASGFNTISSSITAFGSGVATPGSIIISEIMADPDGGSGVLSDADGEWFELYNNNTFSVDINGWTIKDLGTDNITISGTLTIPADDFIVIGANTTTTANGNLVVDYDFGAFYLSNTDDEIILMDGTTEINRAVYTSSAPTGSSLVFVGTASDNNNDPSLWTTSDFHEKGYLDESNTDNGSPGTNGFVQKLVKSTVWTGSGNWSTGNTRPNNNWSKGYPYSITDVTVGGGLTVDINTPAVCNNLTINLGFSLTVSPGKSLTVYGNIANNSGSAAGLYLQANAANGVSSLITYGTVTVNATMESYFDGLDKWYLVSSPISNGKGGVFTDDYFYYWNEPSYAWVNVFDINYSLIPGSGYVINKKIDYIVTYSGTLNTGTITSPEMTSTSLSIDDDAEGWNLMGNPYPSVIDISLLDFTDLSSGIHVNLHNETTDYYVFWSKTLGTVGSSGGSGDIRARYIQPGQGFWVQSHVNGHTFDFTNEMRTHTNQSNFSKSATFEEEEKTEVLKLSFSAFGLSDPTYIAYRDRGTLDFDWEYDLHKMISAHPEVPHIFSLASSNLTEKMAVNAIEQPLDETVIPIGVRLGTSGNYMLNVDGINDFTEMPWVFLKDKLNGNIYDLRQQSVIEFVHTKTNADYRFDLIFGLRTDINNPNGITPLAEVYSFANRLYIRLGENQKAQEVVVKNLLGQTVFSGAYTELFRNGVELNVRNAFYIVELQLENERFTKKVFIQN